MDEIDQVAMHIAEALAPDEVDVAPSVARALAEHGPAASRLRGTDDAAMLGGMSAGDMMELVSWQTFSAIALCAGFVIDVLSLSEKR